MTVVIKTVRLSLAGNVRISIDKTRFVFQNVETVSSYRMKVVMMVTLIVLMAVLLTVK